METFPIYGDSLAFELLYAYIWWTAAWVTFHLAIQVVLLLTQRSGVFDSQSMPAIRLSIASITHATVGASVWIYSTAFDKTQLLTATSLAIGYFTVDLAQAQFFAFNACAPCSSHCRIYHRPSWRYAGISAFTGCLSNRGQLDFLEFT
jgi:hypothetical protein